MQVEQPQLAIPPSSTQPNSEARASLSNVSAPVSSQSDQNQSHFQPTSFTPITRGILKQRRLPNAVSSFSSSASSSASSASLVNATPSSQPLHDPHDAYASAINLSHPIPVPLPLLPPLASNPVSMNSPSNNSTPPSIMRSTSGMGPRSFSVSSQYKGVNNKLIKAQDKQGTKLINQYTVIREIGRGVHGKVKVAEDTEEGGLWAIKIVDKHAKKRFQSRFAFSQSLQNQRLNSATSQSSNNANASSISSKSATLSSTLDAMNNVQLEKIKREIAILKKIDHANVVGLREVIDDPEAAKIYLVLEYMAGGEVEWRDLSYDPPRPVMRVSDARRILRDVLRGLEYLHHNGIIHRDIKPANLLWDSQKENVKISDFGVSVFIDVTSQDTAAVQMELAKTAGSPAFFAPELCAVVDDDDDDDEKTRDLHSRVQNGAAAVAAENRLQGDQDDDTENQTSTSFNTISSSLHSGRMSTPSAFQGYGGPRMPSSGSSSNSFARVMTNGPSAAWRETGNGKSPFAEGTKATGPVIPQANRISSDRTAAVASGEFSDAIGANPQQYNWGGALIQGSVNSFENNGMRNGGHQVGKGSGVESAKSENLSSGTTRAEGYSVFDPSPDPGSPRTRQIQSLITSGLSSLETSPVLVPKVGSTASMAATAMNAPAISINDLDFNFPPTAAIQSEQSAATSGEESSLQHRFSLTSSRVSDGDNGNLSSVSVLTLRKSDSSTAQTVINSGLQHDSSLASQTGGFTTAGYFIHGTDGYVNDDKAEGVTVFEKNQDQSSNGLDRGRETLAEHEKANMSRNEKGSVQAAKPIARHKSPMSGMERYRLKHRSTTRVHRASSEVMRPDGAGIAFSARAAIEIGAAIDVWALGVTLFCLVFGRVPFVAETEFELFHVICKAPLVFPSEPSIDDQLKDLLVKMLDKNPETRIRIPEIKAHGWVTQDLESAQQAKWNLDPASTFGRPLTVTDEEVSLAVRPVLMARLKDGLRKLSISFASSLGLKQRSKSLSSMFGKTQADGVSSSGSPTPSGESTATAQFFMSQRPPSVLQDRKASYSSHSSFTASKADGDYSIYGKSEPMSPRSSSSSWFGEEVPTHSPVPRSSQSISGSYSRLFTHRNSVASPVMSHSGGDLQPSPSVTPTPITGSHMPKSDQNRKADMMSLNDGFRATVVNSPTLTQKEAFEFKGSASTSSLASLLATASLAKQIDPIPSAKTRTLSYSSVIAPSLVPSDPKLAEAPSDDFLSRDLQAAIVAGDSKALEKQRKWRERVMKAKFERSAAVSSSGSDSSESDADDGKLSFVTSTHLAQNEVGPLSNGVPPRASFLLGAAESGSEDADDFATQEKERVKQWKF
ncbi:hypothetical protein HDU77_003187 [Chytriomyces hyalinus]|nr:hypothetical protein HDU77_003187 [Chytriomyces hyalinus]